MLQRNEEILLKTYNSTELPEKWLEELYNKKYFKLFIPHIYGGLESPLVEGMKKIYEAGCVHGSLGWCVNLGAGAGYFWSLFDHETALEIFSPYKNVISGSGMTSGKIINGSVTGGWGKCTGAGYATWFTANAITKNDEVLSFAVPRKMVNISPEWGLFALKATSSFAITVDHVEITDNYFFKFGECKNNASTYELLNIPFEPFARLCMLAAFLGMTRCFTNHVLREFPSYTKMLEHIKDMNVFLDNSMADMEKNADELWRNDSNQLSIDVGSICQKIYNQCNLVFYQHGMILADESNLCHHAWKDVILATQHFLLR